MKILVIRYSGLGDVVMLLPTLLKLKQKYKNSHITLLTDQRNRDMQYLSCELIDHVISVDRVGFKTKGIVHAIKEIYKLIKNVRSHFELCIDFQSFGETATISYLSDASIKIGAPKKSKYHYGYTKIIPRNEKGHRSQFFARIAQVDDSLSYPKMCLDKNLDNSLNIIGLNIGSTQNSRRWSHKNFSELARHLIKKHSVRVYLGPLELKFEDFFQNINVEIVKNLNLIELSESIRECSLLISNDTGPVHIAAALGVPTFTLFSTGDDEDVGALSKNKAHIKNTNINNISVAQVIKELETSALV